MEGILRVGGGAYWDYWFAEREIVRVSLVSQSVVLIALLVMLTLTVLFRIIGALIGVLVLVFVYSRIGKTARKKRSMLEDKSIEDSALGKMIDLHVPYSEVTRAELARGRLTVVFGHRKVRIKIPPGDAAEVEALLQSKLAEKLTVISN